MEHDEGEVKRKRNHEVRYGPQIGGDLDRLIELRQIDGPSYDGRSVLEF